MRLILLLFLIGCVSYPMCKPMYQGAQWSEWEQYHNTVEVGKYVRDCVYTNVLVNGDYTYECTWSPYEH